MPKVMIVDDALTDRVRVSGIASKWLDCTVVEAENGRAALEQIESVLPDLVLTDLHMPEMNGLELVSALKEDFPQIPVILMTAQGSEEIAAQALRCGAASYVPKLRLADDLLSTLNQVYGTAKDDQSQSYLMHYLTESAVSFSLPNDRTLIKACVKQLLKMLRCLPLGNVTERLRMGIALEEAMNNACYHGNLEVTMPADGDRSRFDEIARERCFQPPFSSRKIQVSARISRETARFQITDEGQGFDVATINGVGLSADVPNGPGRGLTLMRSIMDEVTFNAIGNSVTLVRHAVKGDDALDDEDE